MTIAAVGAGGAATSKTITGFTPSGVNNFILLTVVSETVADPATALSSSNVTWTEWVSPVTTGSYISTVFIGKVTAASSATLTVTTAGSPTVRIAWHEYSTTAGYSSLQLVTSASANGLSAFPSITTTAGQMYWSFLYANSGTTAGSTSGFSYYIDPNSNPMAWDTSCSAGAQAPNIGTADTLYGVAVTLQETVITSTGSVAAGSYGVSGTGTAGGPISSTGSVTLGALGVSGSGLVPIVATGSVTSGTLGTSGSGLVPIVTSGSVTRGAAGVSGAASVSVISTGSAGMGAYGVSGITSVPGAPITATGSARMGSWGVAGVSGAAGSFDLPPTGLLLPGADLDPMVELYLSGSQSWLDVSSRVFYDTISLQRGGPDESTTTSPAVFSGTLDNHDGVLSNLNPMSPYYGELGLNTPLRVSVPNGSTYMRCEGVQTDYAACPSSSAINTAGAGNFEVWFDADLDNWFSPQVLAAKWATSANERSWMLVAFGDGRLQFIVAATASPSSYYTWPSAQLPITHGRMSVRVEYTASTGTVSFYTGQQCASWTQLGSTLSYGTSLSPYAAAAPLSVAWCSDQSDFSQYVGCLGKIYAFALLSGNGGTFASNAVASADFTQIGAGSTTFTDGSGNAWALANQAVVSNRDYRFHGESDAWPQSWSVGGPNARIALSAGGLLRRLGQVNTPAGSAMYRAYTRLTTAGSNITDYWPMEDLSQATQIASATGGIPGIISGPAAPGGSSDFACSQGIPTLSGGALTFVAQSYAPGTTSGYSGSVVRFLLTVPDSDTAGGTICRVRVEPNAAGLSYIELIYNTGGTSFTCNGVSTSGSNLWTSTFGVPATSGVRASFEMINYGSTWNASFVWLPVGTTTGYADTLATGLSGQPPVVAEVIFNANQALALSSTAVGHLSIQDYWTSLFSMYGALNAYDQEPAGIRHQRICGEEGLAFRSMGNLSNTVLMGPQTVETVSSLLQECADADQGIWYEPKQVLGWGYRTRASLANQIPAVTFDYNQDHLSDTLEPTVDDQVIKNDVTVTSQNGGSSARAVLNDGSPTSVGKIGRYDTEVTANVDNSLLASQAGWLLWLLSCGQPRFQAINCDLANSSLASLYYSILQLDVGDRINVANPPVWLPPGVVDQLVKGTKETISSKAFTMAWNGIPCLPWNVAMFNDPVYGRFNTDGSQLASAVTSTGTTLSVATVTSGSPLWTTAGGDFPFNIAIEGEEITVTNITGSSSPQTFTVTRSVNGVVKSHPANAAVTLTPVPVLSL